MHPTSQPLYPKTAPVPSSRACLATSPSGRQMWEDASPLEYLSICPIWEPFDVSLEASAFCSPGLNVWELELENQAARRRSLHRTWPHAAGDGSVVALPGEPLYSMNYVSLCPSLLPSFSPSLFHSFLLQRHCHQPNGLRGPESKWFFFTALTPPGVGRQYEISLSSAVRVILKTKWEL